MNICHLYSIKHNTYQYSISKNNRNNPLEWSTFLYSFCYSNYLGNRKTYYHKNQVPNVYNSFMFYN